METINIATLKATLSEVIQRVRNGQEFTILDRKTPVAHLSAVEDDSLTLVSRATGKLKIPRGVKLKRPVDIVQMLRDDRNRR